MYTACSVTQPCPTLCDPMDCSPPSSSVRGILQARLLEWVAISSSRGSSWPRDWTCVSCISASAGSFFTTEPPASFAIAICYSFLFLFAKSANPTCNVTCLWILSVCQRINHWAFSTIKYLVWGFLLYICLLHFKRKCKANLRGISTQVKKYSRMMPRPLKLSVLFSADGILLSPLKE